VVMVSESFRCRPSPRDWSILSQKVYVFFIEALYVLMVSESFRCRPSPRHWSNLSQKVIVCKKFMFLDRGPLRGNGLRILWR